MSIPNQPLPALIDILLVDDDPADVMLTRKALAEGKVFNTLSVAKDGCDAMAFLRREEPHVGVPRPDLILLDLNMPRKDGRETLNEIKADEALRMIPVVILTTSDNDDDVTQSYNLQASCYITKPVDLPQFTKVVQSIKDFWLCVVKYPQGVDNSNFGLQ